MMKMIIYSKQRPDWIFDPTAQDWRVIDENRFKDYLIDGVVAQMWFTSKAWATSANLEPAFALFECVEDAKKWFAIHKARLFHALYAQNDGDEIPF